MVFPMQKNLNESFSLKSSELMLYIDPMDFTEWMLIPEVQLRTQNLKSYQISMSFVMVKMRQTKCGKYSQMKLIMINIYY